MTGTESALPLVPRFGYERPRLVERTLGPGLDLRVIENRTHRWLEFGNGVLQSAMDKRSPDVLVLPYTCSMLASLLFERAGARRAPPPGEGEGEGRDMLLLGLGGASLPRFLARHLSGVSLTVVELSPLVTAAARRWFGIPDSVRIVEADAREGLARLGRERRDPFDIAFVDIFDQRGMPEWVRGEGFLASLVRVLGDGGTLVLNTMPEDDEELRRILEAVRRHFPGGALCTTLADYRNVIVLGFRARPEPLALRALGLRARVLEERLGVPMGRIFRNLCAVNRTAAGRLAP